MEKCKDCKYYDKIDGEHIGQCLRYPSVMTVDRAVETKDVAYWGHPIVNRDNRCGEFVQNG